MRPWPEIFVLGFVTCVICMRKELTSIADGHHEYQMTCTDKSICDGGSDLTIPFGKRHVNSRDISVTCCVNDLCNYPETTTTTTKTTTMATTKTTTTRLKATTTQLKQAECPKDIIVMVDARAGNQTDQAEADCKNITTSVIQRMRIGPSHNMVAFYSFGNTLQTNFDLNRYNHKSQVISHINSYDFFTKRGHTNTTLAIHSLLYQIKLGIIGDRPNYPDVFVIIGNHHTTLGLQLSSSDRHYLNQLSRDVIVLDIKTKHQQVHNVLNDADLATDQHHVIHLLTEDLHDKRAMIIDKLYKLIVKC